MKKNLVISIRLTLVFILLCAVVYPLLVAGIGSCSPGGGNGKKIISNNRVVGYENIGQQFTGDGFFQGRPSAVDYNAAGSGGSNKGPSNPEYLTLVSARIDSFLVHNPAIPRKAIPAELVTASGSGLDPHLSPEAALVQVPRVAAARHIAEDRLRELVRSHTTKVLFGPSVVNVLKLNLALEQLK